MKVDCVNVVLLHEHSEYLGACSDLLNKQWKRSFSARVQSLEKSYKDLPDSLVLIEESDGEKRVIGHSRLTRVLEDDYGCWIGSVVISEESRKKGYGKYLMQKTEEYAKRLNFRTAYLNTRDQQGFYEHLGYIYCSPVSSITFTSNILMKTHQNNFSSVQSGNACSPTVSHSSIQEKEVSKTVVATGPPPPPPPPSILNNKPYILSNLGQYWMKKGL